MGTVTKLSGLAAALAMSAATLSVNPALAADLLVDPPVIEAPEAIAQGGWYLRGDITYDFRSSEGGHKLTSFTAQNAAGDPVPGLRSNSFDNFDMEDSFDIGIGLGYQISEMFRVDATAEYVFSSDWSASTVDTNFVCAGLQTTGGGSITDGSEPGNCNTDNSAGVSQIKVLGNAYLDLGTFGGFTPYVGAGIGGAYVMYDDINMDVASQFQTCCATLDGDSRSFDGESSWRFAYALHAGASFDLTHKMKFDVGYSYTDIAGGKMGSSGDEKAYDDGFTDHVIRAGVRYSLW